MSFIGTQQKCRVCNKTVYLMDQLSADGVTYHNSCFKCNHCKTRLQPHCFASTDGILYCRPHFVQLFKKTGNFSENFQSPTRLADKSPELKPELTRSPSKASRMFSGTQEKCLTCSKTVYPIEKVTVENQFYHKSCFKCTHGGCSITPSNYAALDGVLYCKHHFSQLFREKDSYAHIMKSASMRRTASPIADTAVAVTTPAPASEA